MTEWRGLSPVEKGVIAAFAGGDVSCKDAALIVYRDHIRRWNCRWGTDAYMDFMSEVDTPMPDLSLRATYRQRVRALAESPKE